MAYVCATCGNSIDSLGGTFLVAVQLMHYDDAAPDPPGGRMLDAISLELVFDRVECRDAWSTKAGVTVT